MSAVLADETRVTLRPLSAGDAPALRRLRLEALREDARLFAANDEAHWSLAQWRAAASETTHQCVLGAFKAAALIGMTRITPWAEDESHATALFGSSYITRGERDRGLAHALYAARLDWASNAGVYRRAVVFHREGNGASRRLNEETGARLWRTRPLLWANGETADALWYEVSLTPAPAHSAVMQEHRP